MEIEEYDKVLLKDGATGFIVEIFNGGEAFLADIKRDGKEEEQEIIKPEQIEKVIG